MVGLDDLISLIQTVLYTGQVIDERPVSMILVAPPGTGKTSILQMFPTETSHFLSDLTSRDIREVIEKKPHLTHIILGDFLALLGHSKGTVKLSLNLISRLTGDEMTQAPWTGEKIEPRQIGLLTAIPPDDLEKRDIRNHFKEGGFASRFILARFRYTAATTQQIHEYIESGEYRKKHYEQIQIEPKKFRVEIPNEIANKIRTLAHTIKNDPVGFRAHHYLRTLACAHARMSARNVVTHFDYEKLLTFCEYFTENGKAI